MSSENQESTATELTKPFEAAVNKRKERWTAQEDRKVAEAVAIHGAKKWTSIASKAGFNRSGKSCRLRWMNFLSPNIKRGNMSDQEEDLIIRLHKLLGNRWSLIAGWLPGRTDMEIKNYWNTHLSKKIDKQSSNGANSTRQISTVDKKPSLEDDDQKVHVEMKQEYSPIEVGTSALLIKKEVMIDQEDYCNTSIDVDGFFDFANEAPLSLEIPQIPYLVDAMVF